MNTICITICTRARPKMLMRALKSCVALTADPRASVRVIVIENGAPAGAGDIVESFRPQLDIDYVNAPLLGLVNARNAAIEAFLKTDADWMASVDDDGGLDPNWLFAMLNAIQDFPDCNAFAGPDPQVELENPTKWLPVREPAIAAYGAEIWNVSTANIIFRRKLLEKSGLNLRYNMAFNFSGGEDTHFFAQIRNAGESIIWVPNAISLEIATDIRGTFADRKARVIQSGQNSGRIKLMELGGIQGRLVIIARILRLILKSVVFLGVGVLLMIFDRPKGTAKIAAGLRFYYLFVGGVGALFSKLGERYANPDGE